MRLARRIALVSLAILAPACATAAWVTQAYEADHGARVDGLSAARPALVLDDADLRAHAHVILVTLDGARWQDVLHQRGALSATPAMPRLLASALANGAVRTATISAKKPLSLPGYLTLYAGRTSACTSNECARTTERTLLDAFGADAAVFASWSRLPFAFRADTGAFVDAPPVAPDGVTDLAVIARPDAVTVERGLAYWRAHHPRFFHLALLDMDSHGHAGDADALVASLHEADDAIAALLAAVRELPPEERRATTLIVTADHGRGPGPLWHHHSRYAAARNIFVVAVGDLVGPGFAAPTQADLRRVIERAVGM